MAVQCSKRIGIFGGGPAGLSAALWLKNLGFEPWIVEPRASPGGMQNFNFLANTWVLGQTGVTGPELVARFVSHANGAGVTMVCGVRPTSVEGAAGTFHVALTDESGRIRHEDCAALLIATGTRYREAEVLRGVQGLDAMPTERIAFGPFAFADLGTCTDSRILIVGGGDNAFENARLLHGKARMIHMALRSPPCAQQSLVDIVSADADTCRIHHGSRISALAMRADGIEVTLTGSEHEERIGIDRIHVLAGYEPNTLFLKDIFGVYGAGFHLDNKGYLIVDAAGRTNVKGVYAAGDVCNPEFPSVVTAVAQGSRAAKAIELDLRR